MFRPAGHPLPPSRGREAWELHADGSLAVSRPGPADAPKGDAGTWALEGSDLVLRTGDDERSLLVVRVDEERLVVR